jgi:hypothetical protein
MSGRGLPTALPAVYGLALYEAAGVGFAVMSGIFMRDHSRMGQLFTRQGISLDSVTTIRALARLADRSFLPASLRRRRVRTISSTQSTSSELVGVWSLRILKTLDGSRLRNVRTAKSAFTIHKTDDPSFGPESFLLVFRTSHIVTVVYGLMGQTTWDTHR